MNQEWKFPLSRKQWAELRRRPNPGALLAARQAEQVWAFSEKLKEAT